MLELLAKEGIIAKMFHHGIRASFHSAWQIIHDCSQETPKFNAIIKRHQHDFEDILTKALQAQGDPESVSVALDMLHTFRFGSFMSPKALLVLCHRHGVLELVSEPEHNLQKKAVQCLLGIVEQVKVKHPRGAKDTGRTLALKCIQEIMNSAVTCADTRFRHEVWR